MIASVVFNHNWESKEYHYLVDFNVSPMDDVLVPVGEYGHIEVATVVAVWTEKIDHKYHFPRCLKTAIGRADREELITRKKEEIDKVTRKYDKLLSKVQ